MVSLHEFHSSSTVVRLEDCYCRFNVRVLMKTLVPLSYLVLIVQRCLGARFNRDRTVIPVPVEMQKLVWTP